MFVGSKASCLKIVNKALEIVKRVKRSEQDYPPGWGGGRGGGGGRGDAKFQELYKQRLNLVRQLKASHGKVEDWMDAAVMAGIVLHHADVHGSHKPIFEQGFREGILHTIISTSTLATGVNLPADSVVIFDVDSSGYLLDKELHNATLFNQVQEAASRIIVVARERNASHEMRWHDIISLNHSH